MSGYVVKLRDRIGVEIVGALATLLLSRSYRDELKQLIIDGVAAREKAAAPVLNPILFTDKDTQDG